MSSFAALNGAFTSLTAQRLALEVTGQNIANANTAGYTRQRAELQAINGGGPTMFGATAPRATGVQVSSIDRLGDVFLETKLRAQTSSSGYLSSVAETWSLLESTIDEPSENGLAASLDTFFSSWQDVANRPDDSAARSVLLGSAASLISDIAGGYQAVANQWDAGRTRADAMARDVNTTATAVAELNGQIRSALVAGQSANALIDQRGILLEGLSGMVGAEVRERPDGTVDVMVAGNALVRGDNTHAVAVHGSPTLADFSGAGPEPSTGWGPREGGARLVWAESGSRVGAGGGRLTGLVDTLAPATQGGPLHAMAETYDALATGLAAEVNALHSAEPAADGTTRDFFAFDAGGAGPALSLSLAVTGIDDIVVGVAGEIDGSIASQISTLSETRGLWTDTVVELGVDTRTAVRRAMASEVTRASAEGQLLAQTSVDLDEESINLVMYQRAYEAAARVLTTVDEMLDTLINRTGVVGR